MQKKFDNTQPFLAVDAGGSLFFVTDRCGLEPDKSGKPLVHNVERYTRQQFMECAFLHDFPGINQVVVEYQHIVPRPVDGVSLSQTMTEQELGVFRDNCECLGVSVFQVSANQAAKRRAMAVASDPKIKAKSSHKSDELDAASLYYWVKHVDGGPSCLPWRNHSPRDFVHDQRKDVISDMNTNLNQMRAFHEHWGGYRVYDFVFAWWRHGGEELVQSMCPVEYEVQSPVTDEDHFAVCFYEAAKKSMLKSGSLLYENFDRTLVSVAVALFDINQPGMPRRCVKKCADSEPTPWSLRELVSFTMGLHAGKGLRGVARSNVTYWGRRLRAKKFIKDHHGIEKMENMEFRTSDKNKLTRRVHRRIIRNIFRSMASFHSGCLHMVDFGRSEECHANYLESLAERRENSKSMEEPSPLLPEVSEFYPQSCQGDKE